MKNSSLKLIYVHIILTYYPGYNTLTVNRYINDQNNVVYQYEKRIINPKKAFIKAVVEHGTMRYSETIENVVIEWENAVGGKIYRSK